MWQIITKNIMYTQRTANDIWQKGEDYDWWRDDNTNDEIKDVIKYVPYSEVKIVKVTYFKPSGKYYTSEYIEIPSDMSSYDALYKELPQRHRIKSMFMLVQNSETEGEELEPYIVSCLFHPKESWN
ncbi:hypothetical protein [Paenibacillus xylaniclasticus]|uniref:hypothetical protein n=1 Tax=Paenibacillus xylaniclasticus TaxID=588083 RepID=UPI0017516839|nr:MULTISPECIES: hypothetical protein [Paenibacillus]GFN32401.1 hypothetical protein PCURB6_26610 [Paenibacillus curdlanolyticus]